MSFLLILLRCILPAISRHFFDTSVAECPVTPITKPCDFNDDMTNSLCIRKVQE